MNDTDTTELLERLARTFPERPAPLPELVAAAHAGRRRRTHRNVALAAVACVLAVGAGVGMQQALPDDGAQRTDRIADSPPCDRDAPRTAPSSPVPQGPDYPTNAAGETYGGHTDGRMPDLVAAVGDCGRVGYVRSTELDPPPWSPGAGGLGPREVPLYASDGVTQVDTYTSGSAASPPPGSPSGPDASDVQGEWVATIAGITDSRGVERYDTFRDLPLRIAFGDDVEVYDGCDTVRASYTLDRGVFALTVPDAVLTGPPPSCTRSAPLLPVLRNVRLVTQSGKRTYLHLENGQIAVVLTRP